jgi:hypothetical protein
MSKRGERSKACGIFEEKSDGFQSARDAVFKIWGTAAPYLSRTCIRRVSDLDLRIMRGYCVYYSMETVKRLTGSSGLSIFPGLAVVKFRCN